MYTTPTTTTTAAATTTTTNTNTNTNTNDNSNNDNNNNIDSNNNNYDMITKSRLANLPTLEVVSVLRRARTHIQQTCFTLNNTASL